MIERRRERHLITMAFAIAVIQPKCLLRASPGASRSFKKRGYQMRIVEKSS